MAAEDRAINKFLIREKQRNLLVEKLADLRVKDKADVVLTAGEIEFYAHRLILEAVSPYFVTVFRSPLEEGAVKTISFNDMASETLDAVLDFVYLGELEYTKTHKQITNVLHAAYMMQLPDLVKYCCNKLLQILSPDNFFGIWMVFQQYAEEEMLEEVLTFIVHNIGEVLTKNTFLFVTFPQLKSLLNYATDRLKNFNELLLGLFRWLKHDLKKRSKFAAELLACVDAKLVSSQCLESIVKESSNDEIIHCNSQQFERLNQGCVQYFEPKQQGNLISHHQDNINSRKITFFAQHKVNHNSNFISYVQQFDLESMSWLPAVELPNSFQVKVQSLCQYDQYLCLVGAQLGESYALYDIKQNTIEYISCEYNAGRANAAMCCFKNCIFLVGGSLKSGVSTAAVHYLPLNRKRKWFAALPLTKTRVDPTVLTTKDTMFVTGGNEFSYDYLTVDCTTGPQLLSTDNVYSLTWSAITVCSVVNGLKAHVLMLSETVHCRYVIENDSKQIKEENKEQVRGLKPPEPFANIKSFLHFPGDSNELYVATSDDQFGIPNFSGNLETGQWIKLTPPKGKCEISGYQNIQAVNTLGL